MDPERGQLYVKVGWDRLHQITQSLGETIRHALQGPGYPERIAAVGRGGLVASRILADSLGVRHVAYLGIEAIRSGGKVEIRPNWEDVATIKNGHRSLHRTLFVDDIADSGTTIGFLRNRFPDSPIAVVFSRHAPGSGRLAPDFAGRILDPKGALAKAWIVFPYETRESEALFAEGVEVPLP